MMEDLRAVEKTKPVDEPAMDDDETGAGCDVCMPPIALVGAEDYDYKYLCMPSMVTRCVEINCNALHAIDAMDSMAWDSLVYFLTAVEQGRRRAAAVPRQGREAAPDALADHGPAARAGHPRRRRSRRCGARAWACRRHRRGEEGADAVQGEAKASVTRHGLQPLPNALHQWAVRPSWRPVRLWARGRRAAPPHLWEAEEAALRVLSRGCHEACTATRSGRGGPCWPAR